MELKEDGKSEESFEYSVKNQYYASVIGERSFNFIYVPSPPSNGLISLIFTLNSSKSLDFIVWDSSR